MSDASTILLQIPGVSRSLLSRSLISSTIPRNADPILKYLANGCEHVHNVKNPVIIELNRKGEERLNNHKYNNKKRLLLWHGTKVENIVSIIEDGFRISTPNCHMLGKGACFSDRFSNCIQNYFGDTSHGSTSYLLLCEVVIGQCYIADKTHNFDTIPIMVKTRQSAIPWDSVLRAGKQVPDVTGQMIQGNKCIIPFGKSVENKDAYNCTNTFNEYIIYNPDQIKLRYIVKLEIESSPDQKPSGVVSTPKFEDGNTNDGVKWVPMINGEIPELAVSAGRDSGYPVYVARTQHGRGLIPGKIHKAPGQPSIQFPYDGREFAMHHGEVG